MKIEEKQCVTLVRDFVLEKIKNKSAGKRDLLQLIFRLEIENPSLFRDC